MTTNTPHEYTEREQNDIDARDKGRAFAAEYGLRERVSIALAYKRMGYSASGISKRMDITEGTIKGYLDTAVERFGGESIELDNGEIDPRGEAALWPYHANKSDDPLQNTKDASNTDTSDGTNRTDGTHDTDNAGDADRPNGAHDDAQDALSAALDQIREDDDA